MKTILLYLPGVGTAEQVMRGMAGQNTQNYQNMLWALSREIGLADDLGFWGAAFTEHHFHIEGMEVSNNPIMLDLYFGMQTKNIRMGQLANVIPLNNPIRVAEDMAMLDHMLRGRTFFGMARGYQRRWADVIGQHYGVRGTESDQSDNDTRNRELFYENYEVIKKAWTNSTFSHQGKHWKIPTPDLKFPHEAVGLYGRGQTEDGYITEVGIAPQPYQKPFPPIFQPFSFSPETFSFAARENLIPIALSTDDEILEDLFTVYRDETAKMGRDYKMGQNVGVMRHMLVSDDGAEARRYGAMGSGFIWPAWFAPAGFNNGFRKKGDTNPAPLTCDYNYMLESGFELVGTPDEINRRIEALTKKNISPEYLVALQYSGPVPNYVQMKSLELWATQVAPNWL
jgi:alkanesulfonate monooxygenase SsuD/methylene tetrahydromethanopterin reductase-like flavin-dependent oxidoreductase (luciferase family)